MLQVDVMLLSGCGLHVCFLRARQEGSHKQVCPLFFASPPVGSSSFLLLLLVAIGNLPAASAAPGLVGLMEKRELLGNFRSDVEGHMSRRDSWSFFQKNTKNKREINVWRSW